MSDNTKLATNSFLLTFNLDKYNNARLASKIKAKDSCCFIHKLLEFLNFEWAAYLLVDKSYVVVQK